MRGSEQRANEGLRRVLNNRFDNGAHHRAPEPLSDEIIRGY
jgi:hypothetical protein